MGERRRDFEREERIGNVPYRLPEERRRWSVIYMDPVAVQRTATRGRDTRVTAKEKIRYSI